jgi:two-component system, OmpR family, phosphate regulon sensor histidine kinase PhoR
MKLLKLTLMVVQDTGIGIPADEIDSVFERFYRSKGVKDAQLPGTGLGLAIVKEVAQAHGGRVVVESTPGLGTTFSAWFPRVQTNTAKTAEHS